MDNEKGGLDAAERQRATAAEIARRKVLEAYGKQASNFVAAADVNKDGVITHGEAEAVGVRDEDWRKYHTAWQDYYRNYYGKYYNQAAKNYVEKEKLKLDRELAEGEYGSLRKREKRLDSGSEPGMTKSESGMTKSEAGLTKEGSGNDKKEPEMTKVGGVKGMREKIRKKASGRAAKERRKKHILPIAIGAAIVFAGLMTQYYRVFIAAAVAYIAPGNGAVNSITEIDPTVTAEVGPEPRLIIPKINVDVPIVFWIGNDQASQQAAMAYGVAHFSIPGANAMPGQVGNLVISGHSSNGVFETGDYKFIFAPLERLADGDVIYVNYQSVRYTYRVVRRQVVDPTDVGALVYAVDRPILTLITCVPLGTARQRLLMIAEQISPGTWESGSGVVLPDEEKPLEMPGNSPTMFEGIWDFLTSA